MLVEGELLVEVLGTVRTIINHLQRRGGSLDGEWGMNEWWNKKWWRKDWMRKSEMVIRVKAPRNMGTFKSFLYHAMYNPSNNTLPSPY